LNNIENQQYKHIIKKYIKKIILFGLPLARLGINGKQLNFFL
jgi:hypothetical protein